MRWMKALRVIHPMTGGNSMNGITFLLDLKNKLKAIYAEYSFAIIIVCKFALAFTVFTILPASTSS